MKLIELELFENKLAQLKGKLYRYGMLLTSDHDDAQDLLQDTLLKALENRDKYVDHENLSGWIHTIMRNIFINNYRKSMRNQTFIDTTEDLYQLNQPQNSGIETPEGNYTVQEINKAISAFHDDHRIPFSMFIAGYKYHEIAERMQLPMGTVKSRIYATRQRLQNILKDYH